MKQNGVVFLPGLAFLFFIFRFEYLISGPKSYRDFRETGPRAVNRINTVGPLCGASNFLGNMFNKIPFDAEVDARFYMILENYPFGN